MYGTTTKVNFLLTSKKKLEVGKLFNLDIDVTGVASDGTLIADVKKVNSVSYIDDLEIEIDPPEPETEEEGAVWDFGRD